MKCRLCGGQHTLNALQGQLCSSQCCLRDSNRCLHCRSPDVAGDMQMVSVMAVMNMPSVVAVVPVVSMVSMVPVMTVMSMVDMRNVKVRSMAVVKMPSPPP